MVYELYALKELPRLVVPKIQFHVLDHLPLYIYLNHPNFFLLRIHAKLLDIDVLEFLDQLFEYSSCGCELLIVRANSDLHQHHLP